MRQAKVGGSDNKYYGLTSIIRIMTMLTIVIFNLRAAQAQYWARRGVCVASIPRRACGEERQGWSEFLSNDVLGPLQLQLQEVGLPPVLWPDVG